MAIYGRFRYRWDLVKHEGFFSILGKLLFLILVYGLLLVLVLETEGRGIKWIFAQFPFLEVARDVSPVGLYIFWLVSLWLGFKFGKQVGIKKGAVIERKRIGMPF
jgi:hypothetical protein